MDLTEKEPKCCYALVLAKPGLFNKRLGMGLASGYLGRKSSLFRSSVEVNSRVLKGQL